MDMSACVARRTRSKTESYLKSVLDRSKGINVEDDSESLLDSRTGKKRLNIRNTCSPSPAKKKRRRRKDDDDDVEYVGTIFPKGKRDDEHVVDDNAGSSSVNVEPKSLDFDLDDADLRGEERVSNLKPLSPDDDDVVYVGTMPSENVRVEDDNVGSAPVISPKVCGVDMDDVNLRGEERVSNLNPLSRDDDDVVYVETMAREKERVNDFDMDDVNLRGEEKISSLNPLAPDDDDEVVYVGTRSRENVHVEDDNVGSAPVMSPKVCDVLLDDVNLKGESDEVISLSFHSDEELGTDEDSGEEVSGEGRDSGDSDEDDDSYSSGSDYVEESSDSTYEESSESDFVCSEDEEFSTKDVAKGKRNPSENIYYHEKPSTFSNVDFRDDAIIRESSSEKVDEQGKPRERRRFRRVKEKNHLKGDSFDGGEKLYDVQETIHFVTKDSPPLNLRFGCEEPVLIEKTEEEKVLDGLWEDMALALTMEGIHSSTPAKNGDMLCSKGTHDFVLDEEIGLKCRHCSHVAVEIKDVSPAMDKYYGDGKGNKKYSEKKGDPLLNSLEFDASDHRSYPASVDNTEGTVWQYVPGIKDSLYPHQQEGFEFLWKNIAGTTKLDELNSVGVKESGGCVISHECGTGKTRLTIVFLQSYLERFPDSHPVVIAPATLMNTWEQECRKWNPDIPFYNMNSKKLSGYENASDVSRLMGNRHHKNNMHSIRRVKLKSWRDQKSILGVSYPLYEKLAAEKYAGKMKEVRRMLLEFPGLLVLDEGHTPRNQNSLIWKVLTEVRTEKRIILSGTPFQNNFKELSNILCLARPAYKDTISSRLQELSKWSQEGEHGRVNEETGIVDFRAMIAPFVHIHDGKILEEELPGLRECVVVLNPPYQQEKILKRIDDSQNTFEFEHKLSAVSVHPSLYLCCNPTTKEQLVIGPAQLRTLERLRLDYKEGVKTKFLIDFIRISGTVNEKVLVYSQYIDTLKLIGDQLSAVFGWTEGEEILFMHGQIEQKDRQHLIKNFNKPDSESKVLLASIKACSEGISLVGASRVVFLDVVWNPSVEKQAISRTYRIGQTRAVFTYHLIIKDTSEWDKYRKQSEKHRISELVFSSTKEKDKLLKKDVVSEDKILDEMVQHEMLKDMFEKILYHPKKSEMFTNTSD